MLSGLTFTIIGKKDLPAASKFLGTQVGRIVGVLQGVRLRADRMAMDSELAALQSEVRSGLRELDMVKGELAVAASSQGLVGRRLRSGIATGGGGDGSSNNIGGQRQMIPPSGGLGKTTSTFTGPANATLPSTSGGVGLGSSSGVSISGSDYLEAARTSEATSGQSSPTPSPLQLAPRSQSIAAVAEEEWEKQGIGFKSRAEMGANNTLFSDTTQTAGGTSIMSGGGSLLSDLLQQNLIHDQYDRTVMEQDDALRKRVDTIGAKRKSQNKETNKKI